VFSSVNILSKIFLCYVDFTYSVYLLFPETFLERLIFFLYTTESISTSITILFGYAITEAVLVVQYYCLYLLPSNILYWTSHSFLWVDTRELLGFRSSLTSFIITELILIDFLIVSSWLLFVVCCFMKLFEDCYIYPFFRFNENPML